MLACEDGTWTQLLHCGDGEACRDDAERGAVACTVDANDEIVYGEFEGPCEVDGGEACSTDRSYAMICEGGSWTIGTNCNSEVLTCALLGSEDDPMCSDPDGCIGCT